MYSSISSRKYGLKIASNLSKYPFKYFKGIATFTSGEEGTVNYRVFYKDGDKIISPWHDIPLKNGELFNYINEIPKNTKAKFEIATKEKSNPISQDIKNGKLRDYHGPIFWNYGCLPQTWENPHIEHSELKCFGDNDPLDVVEIGSKVIPIGSVIPVKILGMFAMIDSGELDWKVIAINSEDSLANKLNDINDVEKFCPGVISGIREWFRWYKTPDNKPLNKFGYNDRILDRNHALEVIHETNLYWKDLINGKIDKGKLIL